MPRQYTYGEGYDKGYIQGDNDGFARGFTAGSESNYNEAERKVKEAVELIDLFYKMFPSVKDYGVAPTEAQRMIADKLTRVINIATFTERQRCLCIVEDEMCEDDAGVFTNGSNVITRIKGN